MSSHHTHPDSRNTLVNQIHEFDFNDHMLHLTYNQFTSWVGYDHARPTPHESDPQTTKTILYIASSSNHNYESTPLERDVDIRRLQRQVAELQQAFVTS